METPCFLLLEWALIRLNPFSWKLIFPCKPDKSKYVSDMQKKLQPQSELYASIWEIINFKNYDL